MRPAAQLSREPIGLGRRDLAALPAEDVAHGRGAGMLAEHEFRAVAAHRLGGKRFVGAAVPQQAVDVDARFVPEDPRPHDRLAGRNRPAGGLGDVCRELGETPRIESAGSLAA